MSELRFEQTDAPKNEDLNLVRRHLRDYNRSKAGVFTQQPLAVYARNEINLLIGGATGEVAWGWLFVDMLWVADSYRKQGLGTELLSRLERLAEEYDVIGYHLGTTSFQALDFYRHCGYEVWGELPDFPPGFVNYSLRKLRK